MLDPTSDGDSLGEVLERAALAALGLLAFDWAWGAATRLDTLITNGLLSLPWVADGTERMLQTLLIGGAAGTAVAAEFVIPLLLVGAGTALLGLLLLRIALEVVAALIYVLGGIALGVSPSSIGHRLFQAWLLAATAVFVLPVLWTIVFVAGAAVMLDARGASGHGGFAGFVAQLYNVGAALVVFAIAIKLARAIFTHATGAISTQLAGARGAAQAAAGRRGGPATRGLVNRPVPDSLANFSRRLRGGLAATGTAAQRATAHPLRHPVRTASAARHPVQTTRRAADHLRQALTGSAVTAAAASDAVLARTTRPPTGPRAEQRRQAPENSTPPTRPGRRQPTARPDTSQTRGSTSRRSASAPNTPRPSGRGARTPSAIPPTAPASPSDRATPSAPLPAQVARPGDASAVRWAKRVAAQRSDGRSSSKRKRSQRDKRKHR
jgi:hypothetical protein